MNNNLDEMSNEKLAALAKNGDTAAFGELYDRHAPGVAKAMESFAGSDGGTVDDLTQEVFFKVIKGMASYTPTHPFTHWLYTVALNTGRNHVRNQSKIVFLDNGDIEKLADGQRGEHADNRLAAALMRSVALLPVHLIDVVSLRISAGMSYGEISEIVGIPEGTARSRMHNALRILRERAGIESTAKNAKKEKR